VLSAAAQDEGPLASRAQRVAGLNGDAVDAFWTTLRRNVGRNEHRAVCDVVAYPLVQPEGVVADAAACEARYDAIFTIAVRKAIGTQQYEELFVTPSAVVVGLGELWFGKCPDRGCQATDLRITAVNGHPELGMRTPKGKVLMACHADAQRLQVMADGTGGAEFRLWPAGQESGSPAVQLLRSAPAPQPDGCPVHGWTFVDGANSYTVNQVGCGVDIDPPPMGTVGQLTVTKAGAKSRPVWCLLQ
jgi:hypothetical protein